MRMIHGIDMTDAAIKERVRKLLDMYLPEWNTGYHITPKNIRVDHRVIRNFQGTTFYNFPCIHRMLQRKQYEAVGTASVYIHLVRDLNTFDGWNINLKRLVRFADNGSKYMAVTFDELFALVFKMATQNKIDRTLWTSAAVEAPRIKEESPEPEDWHKRVFNRRNKIAAMERALENEKVLLAGDVAMLECMKVTDVEKFFL
jgi:hypothetical protein